MRVAISFVALLAVVSACKKPDEREEAEKYVARELPRLKEALARRDEVRVTTGCSLTVALDTVSTPLAEEIKRLCYVEAPKLLLEKSVADARKHKAGQPDADLGACMQLFAEQAFTAAAQQPITDPGLRSLVDDYTKLCPEQVAKFAAHPQ